LLPGLSRDDLEKLTMTMAAQATACAAPAEYLRRAEAAAYIRSRYGFPCAPTWLAKLACVGGGPTFRKAGRIPVYAKTECDRWAEERLSKPVRSTSEYQGAQAA
jgi:hypothetical protein